MLQQRIIAVIMGFILQYCGYVYWDAMIMHVFGPLDITWDSMQGMWITLPTVLCIILGLQLQFEKLEPITHR